MELGVTTTVSLVNPDIGDLALEDEGTEVVLSELAAEVAQRLHVRFKFFRGEWFLDLDEGTPYYQMILVKAPQDSVIRGVFGSLIRGTEGVADLILFDYTIAATRQMSLTFKARLKDGTVFSSTDYAPFVITP